MPRREKALCKGGGRMADPRIKQLKQAEAQLRVYEHLMAAQGLMVQMIDATSLDRGGTIR